MLPNTNLDLLENLNKKYKNSGKIVYAYTLPQQVLGNAPKPQPTLVLGAAYIRKMPPCSPGTRMGDNLTSLHAETSDAKLQDRTDDSTFARLTMRGPRKDWAPGRVTEEGTGAASSGRIGLKTFKCRK